VPSPCWFRFPGEKGKAVPADAFANALKAALDLIGQLREDV
jgi:hypothetical protein